MLDPNKPALVLAPMEGITDAPMRTLQGSSGAFTYAVSEFLRVSTDALPIKVFKRDVPELDHGGVTPTGLQVQVQILGGNSELMAQTAVNACLAGAKGIDINFGCPAKTVNRHDGGASLLKHPTRIREIVAAIRSAVPNDIPVSAKLRLGWDSIESIDENASMAAEGGAAWLTIHGRTRTQGYAPPVFWSSIGRVREALSLPVIANGDIWTLDDFHRCRDESGCRHFMIGRGALADPALPAQIACELGIGNPSTRKIEWSRHFHQLATLIGVHDPKKQNLVLMRLKQWMKIAYNHGNFPHFDELKLTQSPAEFFELLQNAEIRNGCSKA